MAKFDKKTAYAKIKSRKVVKIIMKNFNKILGKQEEPAEAKEDFKPKNETLKKIGATALAALVALGIFTDGFSFFKKGKNKNITDNRPTTSSSEKFESESGIHDGYDEYGMFLSETKSGPYNFANAAEVAEVCKNDEVEMIKYTAHNQVESFADYLANLPRELQPEGFKGLSILEAEKKLEDLDDEAFDKAEEDFGEIMEQGFTRTVTVNGRQNNAYMSQKDKSKPTKHENMQLVKCVTNESKLEVTEFYWLDKDGKEIGTMRVKMTPVVDEQQKESFKGCLQVISPVGEKTNIYTGMPEVSQETIEGPVTPNIPSTPDKPAKQWGKEGDPHGGDLVTPSEKVDPKSETTKKQNDSTNAGNQGDASKTPGSASNSNGEQKEMNGKNAYQDQEKIEEGKKKDKSGNDAQKEAREKDGVSPGADNYTDAEEEAAVAGGAF